MSLSSDTLEAKKPCKGILKSSSSFDKHTSAASSVKSAKFDELNVLQTYHPPDKDYGHMKVDEPKTPYNYVEEGDVDQLDAELLAERLRLAANSNNEPVSEEESEEEEEELTEEQKKRKLEFERRRKAHYNEFEAVRMARKLIEEDEDDDDDEHVEAESAAPSSSKSAEQSTRSAPASSSSTGPRMDEGPLDTTDRNGDGSAPNKKMATTTESQAGRLKPVHSSSAILEESSELRGPRSSAIALIMLVSIGLMIFFTVCFTLLVFLVKNSKYLDDFKQYEKNLTQTVAR